MSNKIKLEHGPYRVKSVKTGPSSEYGDDGAWVCTLWCGKKKIADVQERGDGGELWFYWVDPERTTAITTDFGTRKVCAAEAAARKFFLAQTEYAEQQDFFDFELAIIQLVDDYITTRKYRARCKRSTVFRHTVPGKIGEWISVLNQGYNPVVKARLERDYGDSLVEIINERYLAAS